jgi:galactokinase
VVTLTSPVRQATSLFQDRFGSGPATVVSAPGRVNLLGEHTDYNGGPVLPIAVERRTAVAASPAPRWEATSAIGSGVVHLEPDFLEHGSWTGYVVGAIRVLQRRGLAPEGARLAVASTLPIGAGLSSSAALTVAVTRALLALAGRRASRATIADIAYEAEHDEVGVRCGRMDQVAASLARPGHALLFETGDGSIRQVPLPLPVWVMETGVVHRLSDGQFNLRRSECETGLRLIQQLGGHVSALAEVRPAELPRILQEIPAPWGPRIRHVVTEVARTREAAQALAARDLPRLGRLLVEGHESLRADFQSTCPEADYLVETAVRHGAYGARLTGAGWGGAVVALFPEDQESRILGAVHLGFQDTFGREPVVWATRAAAGVRVDR